MASQIFNRIGQLGLGVALVGGVVNSALFNVDGGHRAVIFDRFAGVKNQVVGEGTHFYIPWVQRPIIFDIRARPRNVPVITGSKDLQNVNITLRVLFRPIPDQLPKIYTILGVDYDERVLPSITTEVLKAVVAQFDAGELITQREMVSQKVNEDLTERAGQFGLILDDISITHLTFGKEFTQAVELKQVAQQEAEKARFLVEKAEQTKKATVIAAEGDTQAAQLLAKSFGDAGEGLVELRRIEAAEDIAYQLSRNRNVSYLPAGQSVLLNLPTQELYYENVKYFDSQNDINRALHDICRILKVPIWQVRIQGTAKGLIGGPVRFVMNNGQIIHGDSVGGTLIPQNVLDIVEISSPAKWVLLVEKDAAFQRLIQEGGLNRLGPCLFITGKGFPDVNTRMLVCLLGQHLKVPILALVDADPHGIDIMCTYRFGSQAMSSHSPQLACGAIRWLGVHPTDIARLGIESIPLTQADKDKLQAMLSRPYLAANQAVHTEIKALLDGGIKAEMEGLLKFSSSYITDSYIPSKIICKEYI